MVTFPPHFLLSCVPGGKKHRGTRAEPRALKLKEQNHSLSCISDLYFLPLICDLQHFPQHSLCRRTAHVFFFLFLFLCRLFSKESHTQSSLLSRLTFLFLLCYDFFFPDSPWNVFSYIFNKSRKRKHDTTHRRH